MSYICHICQLVHLQIWDSYAIIYASYEVMQQCGQGNWYTYIPHCWHMLLNKWPATMHISHCTTTRVYMCSPYNCTYQLIKNKLQLLFTMLLPDMCHQQKCPLNVIHRPEEQMTQNSTMEKVCQYRCQTWTCWFQWYGQKCCTQMPDDDARAQLK